MQPAATQNETPNAAAGAANRPNGDSNARAGEAIIRAEKIEKYYQQPSQNRIQVISPTDLTIVPGEIVALLGPSGSGKSTMLRMLSGLSRPSAGQVYWHEKPIAEAEINVSIVFQSFALFPWLTVLENVEAPLQARGVDPEERRTRSMRMLDTVGLDGFESAYPKELSGGMKQRVGFARALVVEPEVLFMDEPFSALDVLTAENLRSELLELWAKKTMPTALRLYRDPQHRRSGPARRPHHRPRPQSRTHPHRFSQPASPAARPQIRGFHPTGRLHLQGAHTARRRSHRSARTSASRPAHSRPAPDEIPDAAPRTSRRRRRFARTPARQGRPRRHLPAGRRPRLRDRRPAPDRRRRATSRIPQGRRRRRLHHRDRH